MPEENSWLGSIITTYIKELLSYYINQIKRKIMHYTVSMILAIVALITIFYGLGSLLGSFFPQWPPGTSHIILGIILIIIAYLYERSA